MDYSKLEDLFISNPPSAIEESQKIICSISNFDSFQDFYNYHLKNAHVSTCQNEWPTPQLCVSCRDCACLNESCICIPCFLNGNHQGHQYVVNKITGNCDCGDPIHWKKSGFCTKHHGLAENECPENYLDEKLRTTLTDVIFKAAFTSIKYFSTKDYLNALQVIQFISSFLKFGDGFRRLISISLTERFDFKDLMQGIITYSTDFNNALQQLCGRLINDHLFLRNFSKISYDIISSEIIKDVQKIIINGESSISYQKWNNFWFHTLSSHCFNYAIEKFNWNWVHFGTTVISYFKELLSYCYDNDYYELPNVLITVTGRIRKAADLQPNEQTQEFFDRIVNDILSCGSNRGRENGIENDTIIKTSFKEETSKFAFYPVLHFQICFYFSFYAFKNKPNLKLDSMFELMEKQIDVSLIFTNTKMNDKDCSFHNGASFFICHPLFESLLYLFRIDRMLRIKIARFLVMQKYQKLRVKIGIIALKSLLSFICCYQSLASQVNKSLFFLYSIYNKEDMASKNYCKIIPLFQVILGLQCPEKTVNDDFSLKEFFAYEMAREIGILDDFTSSDYKDEDVNAKQNQMVFTFLFVSLLLVIERKLFNFDGETFVREQIIFSLKKGIHSIEKLNALNDYTVLDQESTFFFNDILMDIAETSKRNQANQSENEDQNQNENENHNQNEEEGRFKRPYGQETYFYLKDNVEYNTISAINSINEQMTLMNSQILKEPKKLLQIPSFEDEETFFFKRDPNDNSEDNISSEGLNIRLKHFLMTPTVLSIIYHTLRTNSSDLNKHLAMNILILISKFVKEEEEEQSSISSASYDESTEIKYDDLSDLITKMKNVINNYKVDNKGNVSIEFTLNVNNFISLIKMKITSNNLPPMSFVDILLKDGQLGHSILSQISSFVPLDILDKEKDDKQVNEKAQNRAKAIKLKEQIMYAYKDKIANYKGSESLISLSSSCAFGLNQEVCSICSTYKKDEIFTYPLYIFRTKFPFIIDKPPLVSREEKGAAIDDIRYDFDIPCEDESAGEDDEDDGNEEEEQIDSEKIMLLVLNNYPQLANTEGLNEEQLHERYKMIDVIYNSFRNQIVKMRKQEKIAKRMKRTFKKQFKENISKFEEEANKKEFKRCTAGANYILQFNLCQHAVHQNCVKQIPFTCPVDRLQKNSLLPDIDMINKDSIFKDLKTFEVDPNLAEDSLEKSAINSILSFIDSFSSFFRKDEDVFIELIKSISALISTYEIRLRSLPDCLDSDKTSLLARNLFMTSWFAYRIKGKPEMVESSNPSVPVESRLTTFQRLIKTLIECDEIDDFNKKETFHRIVSKFAISENFKTGQEKLLCLFLRRSCLAEHFLLHIDVSNALTNDIIDWDEVLGSDNLSERYGVKFVDGEAFEFAPFTFMKLPKEFLRFYEAPFGFPVEKTTNMYIFNIVDYNRLIDRYDEATGEIDTTDLVAEQVKNMENLFECDNDDVFPWFLEAFFAPRNSPSVLMFISKYASQMFLVESFNIAYLNTFYVDRYGCTDEGYKRSQPLFFNDERYEKLIDVILSGEFSNTMAPIDCLK